MCSKQGVRSSLPRFTPYSKRFFVGFTDRTEEVRRLGMGRLLSDVSEKMSSKAEKGASDPMKILIHSTHDTTLSGLLSTLDVYDDRYETTPDPRRVKHWCMWADINALFRWPAFTAAVTFELFRGRDEESSQTPLWQTVLAPFKQSNDPKEHHCKFQRLSPLSVSRRTI